MADVPMRTCPESLDSRIVMLERSLRRSQWCCALALLAVTGALAALLVDAGRAQARVSRELRTHKLVIVDAAGRPRVAIGEDGDDVDRQSRASGISLFDAQGQERGGMGTMADGSAVIALDAPRGVGDAMPDRVGMRVDNAGNAMVAVISNQGEFAAALSVAGNAGQLDLHAPATRDAPARDRVITATTDEVRGAD